MGMDRVVLERLQSELNVTDLELQQFHATFATLDEDKSGSLSAEELHKVFELVGVKVHAEALKFLVNDLDRDSDGDRASHPSASLRPSLLCLPPADLPSGIEEHKQKKAGHSLLEIVRASAPVFSPLQHGYTWSAWCSRGRPDRVPGVPGDDGVSQAVSHPPPPQLTVVRGSTLVDCCMATHERPGFC